MIADLKFLSNAWISHHLTLFFRSTIVDKLQTAGPTKSVTVGNLVFILIYIREKDSKVDPHKCVDTAVFDIDRERLVQGISVPCTKMLS